MVCNYDMGFFAIVDICTLTFRYSWSYFPTLNNLPLRSKLYLFIISFCSLFTLRIKRYSFRGKPGANMDTLGINNLTPLILATGKLLSNPTLPDVTECYRFRVLLGSCYNVSQLYPHLGKEVSICSSEKYGLLLLQQYWCLAARLLRLSGLTLSEHTGEYSQGLRTTVYFLSQLILTDPSTEPDIHRYL